MNQIEKDSCQLFNTGRFNDIVLAYMMLSMKAADVPSDKAGEILNSLHSALDEMTAEQALERYRGNVK